MFEKNIIIVLVVLCHTFLVIAQNVKNLNLKGSKEIGAKEIEESKKFFKSIVRQANKQPEDEDKPLQASQRGSSRPKVGISGGTRFADDLFFSLFPIGDKYGGIPDSLIGFGKYCVEFVIKGLGIVGYTTIRYPHKFLLKAMVAIGFLAWTTTNAVFCLSPRHIANFIQKAKIANRNQEEMARVNQQWKVRLANTIDRLSDPVEIQRHGCCAFSEFKRKLVEATHDDAKEFIASWLAGFFKMHQIVFCQQYTDASDLCESVQYLDDEPIRMLPRSMMTIAMELMVKYM